MVVGCDVIGFMALLFDFGLLIKPVVLVSCQASCNGTYTYTLGQLSHAVRGHAIRMWPSAPKALRAWNACRTRFEDTQFECGLRPLTTNQPKDNVTPTHTLWENCCTRFEDTQFECGLRPLRPFGPVTRVARGSNVARVSYVRNF